MLLLGIATRQQHIHTQGQQQQTIANYTTGRPANGSQPNREYRAGYPPGSPWALQYFIIFFLHFCTAVVQTLAANKNTNKIQKHNTQTNSHK